MSDEIVNRVANSSLVQIDLDEFLPSEEIISYDLTDNLYEGLILREKDFRDFIKDHNWENYKGKIVAIQCSGEAIVPNWAYMLLASTLVKSKAIPFFGTEEEVREKVLIKNFMNSGIDKYEGAKVILKGCGSFDLSPDAFVEITNALQNKVDSLMFGEACSSVPVFKSARK